MQSSLRLSSYNVHGFVTRYGKHDPFEALSVVKDISADVVALQEVSSSDRDSKILLDEFADSNGYRLIFGPTFRRKTGDHYGNAILIRCSVEEVKLHDISHPTREPRGAIEAIIEYRSQKWQVLATHLGLSPNERRQQVKRLLQLITLSGCSHTVLMGDLNEWFTWGRPLRWLKSYFQIGHSKATFPAVWPIFALDRIWVHPSERISKAEVFKTPSSLVASDHLPIVIEIA
ncbi:MAG: endonuclease/exonuclease/phosphatase family protein [Gammaproteobacteria bacterium]